jgi:predicted ester cyclase
MQEQNEIREVLHQALEALNSKDNKSRYFHLHDDALITHGIPETFPTNKEGMMEYYTELWQAFPEAKFNFEHIIVERNKAACMFYMTGIQKGIFLSIPKIDLHHS